MSKMSPKKALETLAEHGFDIPDEMTFLIKDLDYERRGVVEVWKCGGKDCEPYESPISGLSEFTCKLGHRGKRIYPK